MKMKTYTVLIPYHSGVAVTIEAESEEEALDKAREYEPTDEEILESLQQDGNIEVIDID